MSDKTVINNWTGGGTLQTWPDGEWQILYAKDSAGNCVTLSLTSQDAIRLAYAVSPIPSEQFDRMRAANEAVYELSYPETRAEELREIANEIDCGSGCEGCSPQKIDRGEFCGFVSAESLRKLAAALDLKASLSHQPAPVAANASAEARLREALEKIAGSHWERVGRCQTDVDDVPDLTAEDAMQEARKALSAHPHASDCDKQGSDCGATRCRDLGCFGVCKPSDRTADVTDVTNIIYEALPSFNWNECEKAGRAILDAFTVGRR